MWRHKAALCHVLAQHRLVLKACNTTLVLIEDYRRHYNEVRPHGGLGYPTPTQACNEAQSLDTKVANTVPAA